MTDSPRRRRRTGRRDLDALREDADARNARKRHRLVVLHRLDVIAQRREQARQGLRGEPLTPGDPVGPEQLDEVLAELDHGSED